MELRLYIQMLRRGWWIVVLTALASLAVSLALSYTAVPQYRATARFLISPSPSLTSATNVIDSLNTLDRQSVVSTYAEIMSSTKIQTDALNFLKLAPANLVDYTIQAVVLPSSSVLELNVTASDPQRAAQLANAIGFQTIDFAHRLNQLYDLNFLDQAVPPVLPISPNPARDAGVALGLGLIAGVALAVVGEQIQIPLEAYRTRLRLDPVSGVYTSRYFVQLVEEELQQHPKQVLSIGIIELGGIRDIQDTLSPAVLKELLHGVTEILRNELRGNDVIGRWNENGFIAMLPATPAEAASKTFERIHQALLSPIQLGQYGLSINLGPHIGGAEYNSSISFKDLLGKAEGALDASRIEAGNLIRVWSAGTAANA